MTMPLEPGCACGGSGETAGGDPCPSRCPAWEEMMYLGNAATSISELVRRYGDPDGSLSAALSQLGRRRGLMRHPAFRDAT